MLNNEYYLVKDVAQENEAIYYILRVGLNINAPHNIKQPVCGCVYACMYYLISLSLTNINGYFKTINTVSLPANVILL